MSTQPRFDRQRRRGKYWSTLSDVELMERQLFAADPEGLENLVQEEPQTDEIPEVELEYDTLISGTGRVRCVHCKKVAKNHNRGFVLQFADGRRMLVGKDCGLRHYGADWGGIHGDFKAAQSRKSFLERQRDILTHLGELVPAIEAFAADECWEFYSECKRDLMAAIPTVAQELHVISSRQDGALFADQQIRDELAEADYEARTGRKSGPILKHVSVEMGRLAGKSFFLLEEFPEKRVTALARRLINALHAFGDGSGRTTHDFKVWFRAVDGIVDDLEKEVARYSELAAALSIGNFELLSRWLRARRLGSFSVSSDRFNRHDAAGNVIVEQRGWRRVPVEMAIPKNFPAAPFLSFSEIGALLRPSASQVAQGSKSR